MELCLVQIILRVSICRFGVPHYATNNGSKREGEFEDFCQAYWIEHEHTAPTHLQCNGRAYNSNLEAQIGLWPQPQSMSATRTTHCPKFCLDTNAAFSPA